MLQKRKAAVPFAIYFFKKSTLKVKAVEFDFPSRTDIGDLLRIKKLNAATGWLQ